MGRNPISESSILKKLVVDGATSRADLCQRLGVSKAAVTQIVNRLIDKKIITEGHLLEENRLGRKRIQLSFREGLAYFLGTDLEGLAIRVCLLDSSCRIVCSGKRAIASSWSKAKIVRQWMELIQYVIEKSGVEQEKIVGLGVGLPGTVDRERLSTRAFLPPGKWVDLEISEFMGRLGFNLIVLNNVVCVSEYERKAGAACDVSDFISLLVRYGIGASIYSDSRLTVAQELSTCELGHMRINIKGPECICGQKGCLDVFASGRTWNNQQRLSNRAIGNQLKIRAGYLGIGLANMLKLFHPPVIIINGIYNEYEPVFKPVLQETIAEELVGLKIPVPEIVFGVPMEMKTSTGAAMRVAEEFFEQYAESSLLTE